MPRRRKTLTPSALGLGRLRRRQPLLYLVLTGLFALFAYWQAPLGNVRVVDGDTLELQGQKIRLFGIDAPELHQTCHISRQPWACGEAARKALTAKIGQQDVRCVAKSADTYGREVSVCYLGSENLNAWMVRQGWALAYRQYSHAYVTAEQDAQQSKRGVWRGEFQRPWEWRRHNRRQE